MNLLATIFSSFYYLISFSYAIPTVNEAVRNIGKSINPDINPCENFYEYACGNWEKHNPKPKYKSQWGTSTKLGDNANKINIDILQQPVRENDTIPLRVSKLLFNECLKEEKQSARGLRDLIDKIGGWPLLKDNWNSSEFDWWELAGKIKHEIAVSVLLNVGRKLDPQASSYSTDLTYTLSPASLSFCDQFYQQMHVKPEILNEYQVLIKTVAKELGELNSVSHLDKKVEEIVNFDLQLSEIQRRRDDSDWSYDSTIRGVQFIYSYVNHGDDVNLIGYLNEVYSSSYFGTPKTFEDMNVNGVWYFYKLLLLIEKTPKETLANYIVWRAILAFAPYGNKIITKAVFNFNNLLMGAEEQTPREQTCASLAYGSGVAQKYLEQHFDPEVKQAVVNMAKVMEDMTNDFIKNSKRDRLTQITNQIKVAQISDCIGYPAWLNDSNFLDEKYLLKELDNSTLPFFEKLVILRQNPSDLFLTDLPGEFCDWPFLSADVNYIPYYFKTSNTLNFPMSFLQPPLFSINAIIAINYGALGTVLGHEIAHTLPTTGWTKDTYGNLSSIGNCLVDEYRNLSALNSSEKTQATKTVDDLLVENFPDNVAIKTAFQAYKYLLNSSNTGGMSFSDGSRNYTNDQLFFLSYAQSFCDASTVKVQQWKHADSHGIGKHRVLGTLRNYPQFSSTWQCPMASFMNPTSKCDVFGDESTQKI